MAGGKRDGKVKKKGSKRANGKTETEPLASGKDKNKTEIVRQQANDEMRSKKKNPKQLY